MKKLSIIIALMLLPLVVCAQIDRKEVRAGNRKFGKDNYKEAEIDYRKAAVKDSLSLAANYNLASALYRQQDYEGAGESLEKVKETPDADMFYNLGDVALQKQDYAAAVEAFRNSLLLNPADLDAKENYIYAKKKLEDQQNQQNQDQDQNQNQDQQQDQQDQNQQNQDQNQQDQQQDQQQQPQPKISQQQAQQMLKAIQAKEKDTQDKVNKEKAALLKSQQKEKNW